MGRWDFRFSYDLFGRPAVDNRVRIGPACVNSDRELAVPLHGWVFCHRITGKGQ